MGRGCAPASPAAPVVSPYRRLPHKEKTPRRSRESEAAGFSIPRSLRERGRRISARSPGISLEPNYLIYEVLILIDGPAVVDGSVTAQSAGGFRTKECVAHHRCGCVGKCYPGWKSAIVSHA